MRATVEVEDQVYPYQPADNGAGPLWCSGSTVVARQGDQVFVAGLETQPGLAPLNNCRWLLYRRRDSGAVDGAAWQLVHRDRTGLTREPSPIALLGSGDLLVSANPTLTEAGIYSGPAEPAVFRFRTADPGAGPTRQLPAWSGTPRFSEHSYRTLAADRDRGEVLYLQNEGYDLAHMSLLGGDGRWTGRGVLRWPFGAEYPKPQPLRLCYPNVMLRGGAAHFLGVGDIVEPIDDWRAAKKEITGREWDYVFRRLFYACSPDVGRQPFGDWVELANRDQTAGATRNSDIWVDADGDAHLLWVEVTTDSRLRDRFFAGVELRQSLEYARIRDNRVVGRRTLADLGETGDGLRPELARFHVTAAGQALILAQFSARPAPADGPAVRYRLTLLADADPEWTDVPFARPMGGTFLTNTVRGGSAPGDIVDLVGSVDGPALGYARVRVTM